MKNLTKTFALVMILAAFIALFTGCVKNEAPLPTPNKPDQNKPVKPPVENVTDQGTIPKEGNVILKELALVYNGKTIAISDIIEENSLESILGKASEKKSHTYSPGDGKNMDPLNGMTEVQYKFPGLEIKAISNLEGKDFSVFNIIITDAKYTTPRNIKVGDSAAKLKEAYPEVVTQGSDDVQDEYRYQPVNYVDGMRFDMKGGKIERIYIYKLLD